MNKYEARWRNALKIANTIKKLLKEGYMIFTDEDEQVESVLIREDNILLNLYEGYMVSIFSKETEFECGMEETIKEFNSKFKNWEVIHPKHIRNLKSFIRR